MLGIYKVEFAINSVLISSKREEPTELSCLVRL